MITRFEPGEGSQRSSQWLSLTRSLCSYALTSAIPYVSGGSNRLVRLPYFSYKTYLLHLSFLLLSLRGAGCSRRYRRPLGRHIVGGKVVGGTLDGGLVSVGENCIDYWPLNAAGAAACKELPTSPRADRLSRTRARSSRDRL